MDANYSVFEAGAVEGWRNFKFQVPGFPPGAKQFLKDEMGLKGTEISLNCMRPGQAMPFIHKHKRNGETYLFLSGVGEFYADDEMVPIKSGTCIHCLPEVGRTWRNTGDQDLVFVVVQSANDELGCSQISDGEAVERPVPWAVEKTAK